MDWQSIAAIGVVIGVAVIFTMRGLKRKSGGGCGGGCGCAPPIKTVKTLRQKK